MPKRVYKKHRQGKFLRIFSGGLRGYAKQQSALLTPLLSAWVIAAMVLSTMAFLPASVSPVFAAISFGSVESAANASGGATTLVISKPSLTVSGDFLIAGIAVDKGSDVTITPPAGRRHYPLRWS
ncbi:hypothetical protein HY250_00290 [Candidatus Azambacteria bacterium]|nr:hypothetical protein [Candidatus Azambacteria bacterium]MBI3684838.1 hypothetical protein [Candidatus Azambacteria bacterium]